MLNKLNEFIGALTLLCLGSYLIWTSVAQFQQLLTVQQPSLIFGALPTILGILICALGAMGLWSSRRGLTTPRS
jgi:hypothetical protein